MATRRKIKKHPSAGSCCGVAVHPKEGSKKTASGKKRWSAKESVC